MESCKVDLQYTSPENVGVSSTNIEAYIRLLEDNQFATHSLILARGNQIFYENYWEPFHRNFLHRMYSVTKSFVAIAIGFLLQDGQIQLDDKISKYFSKELEQQSDSNMHNQTIRHMLMMSTAKTPQNWFKSGAKDRVQFYFNNGSEFSRPSGTLFEYDSTGSFVLGALVERLTGLELMEYLRIKLFNQIGVSEDVHCLKCPGGHSWSDSALLCRPMDLLLVARFMLNGGSWNGKQLLDAEYVKAATSKQIPNDYIIADNFNAQGYGYQFWMTYQNSFFFNGMGSQYAVCVPDKDIIMVYNADNQGKEQVRKLIFDGFFDYIVNSAQDHPLPENIDALRRLKEYGAERKLLSVKGDMHSPWEKRIHRKNYVVDKNPMGISRIQLIFKENGGCMSYTNEQGEKEIHFGYGHNVLGDFPQEGYSKDVGSETTTGHFYKYAASGAWIEPHKLQILVQIIDKYFGNLTITLGFQEEKVGIFMHKNAENFLEEYKGYATGVQRGTETLIKGGNLSSLGNF